MGGGEGRQTERGKKGKNERETGGSECGEEGGGCGREEGIVGGRD